MGAKNHVRPVVHWAEKLDRVNLDKEQHAYKVCTITATKSLGFHTALWLLHNCTLDAFYIEVNLVNMCLIHFACRFFFKGNLLLYGIHLAVACWRNCGKIDILHYMRMHINGYPFIAKLSITSTLLVPSVYFQCNKCRHTNCILFSKLI